MKKERPSSRMACAGCAADSRSVLGVRLSSKFLFLNNLHSPHGRLPSAQTVICPQEARAAVGRVNPGAESRGVAFRADCGGGRRLAGSERGAAKAILVHCRGRIGISKLLVESHTQTIAIPHPLGAPFHCPTARPAPLPPRLPVSFSRLNLSLTDGSRTRAEVELNPWV